MKRIITIIALLSGIAHAEQPHAKDIAKLESYIRTADVAQFKAAYKKTEIDQVVETQLLDLAHSTHKEFAIELEAMGNGTINKKKLAIGALQTLGVVYCAENAINPLYMAIKNTTLPYVMNALIDIWVKEKQRPQLIIHLTCRLPGVAACVAFWQLTPKFLSVYAYQPLALIPCALFSFLAYKAFNASTKNIKKGLNYKKHLENQIKNLDEIINHIQLNEPIITTNPREQI